MMKRFILLTVGCAMQLALLKAQEAAHPCRGVFSLEYTTELQTDFERTNGVNQLHLSCEIPLVKSLSFSAGTFTVAKMRESLVDDIQGFSNIDADNMLLALSVCGLRWTKGEERGEFSSDSDDDAPRTEIFAGVHNVNEDFFTSPCTSLFTGSSPGIFPTISAGLPIANYPLAGMGIHVKQSWRDWLFQAALYNGRGYDGFKRHNNPFRINPKNDGILTLASIDYDKSGSNYTLGGFLYRGVFEDTESFATLTKETAQEATFVKAKKQSVPAVWLNIEQKLSQHWHLLLQGSWNFSNAEYEEKCRDYEAFGFVTNFNDIETGIIFNHASFRNLPDFPSSQLDTQGFSPDKTIHEYEVELTANFSFAKFCRRHDCRDVFEHFHLQPALHLIRTDKDSHCVAMLRMIINL